MALAGDHVQVLVAGSDLTGDSNSITIADSRDLYDVTAYADAVHKFLPGERRVWLNHAGYVSAPAASHEALKSAELKGVVSVLLGQNGEPAAGDIAFSLYAQQGQYSTLPEIAKYIPFTGLFANSDKFYGWGVVLAPATTSFTNTTASLTPVNNGVQTTKGGLAFLHVLQAAAADTYAIVVEGSSSGAFAGEQTTLLTFTLNASAVGSEVKAMPSTIPPYTRWKATRSGAAGNTVRIAITLIRY